MKSISFALLLSLSSSLLFGMAQEAEFLTPQQVLAQADPLPEEYASTLIWIQDKELFLRSLRMPAVSSHQDVVAHNEKVRRALKLNHLQNQGTHNFIFNTGHDTIVRYAGLYNTLSSLASSAGIDSGPAQNMWEEDANGKRQLKSSVLQVINPHNPVHQHTSMLAYYFLMRRRLQGKKVQPVQTWAVRYGETNEFCDQNYVVVQPVNPHLTQFGQLPLRERNAILDKERLPDIADAVDAGAWCLSPYNLWYDTYTGTLRITDLEKPNNEGWGPNPGTNPRWGTAVFSYIGDEKSCHPWKWEHNIRYGYDVVEGWLNPDLKPEWQKLKTERAPKE